MKSNFKKSLEAISALYLSEYFKRFSQTTLPTAKTSHSTEMFMCTYSLLVVQEKYATGIHRKFSLIISQADELQYLRKG